MNTTAYGVELTLPPVEIEKFKAIEPAPRTVKNFANSGNPTNSHSDWFE